MTIELGFFLGTIVFLFLFSLGFWFGEKKDNDKDDKDE